jgi:hypothetical protein
MAFKLSRIEREGRGKPDSHQSSIYRHPQKFCFSEILILILIFHYRFSQLSFAKSTQHLRRPEIAAPGFHYSLSVIEPSKLDRIHCIVDGLA